MSWRQIKGMVAAMLVVSAALLIGTANRSLLWVDELFSIAMATGHSLEHPASAADPELGDFIEGTEPRTREDLTRYLDPSDGSTAPARVIRATFLSDTSPPLYYVLLGLWIRLFGASDLGVRFFSIVCALTCIPLIAGIARRTGGRNMIVPACALFALSPITVYYGSEARMYSLLWLTITLVAWAGMTLRTSHRRLGLLLLWVLGSTAGFLTHYFFMFPWVAITAYLFIWPGRLRRAEIMVAGSVMILLLLPWYLHLPDSLNNWRITQGWLNLQPPGYSHVSAMWELTTQFLTGQLKDLWRVHYKAKILSLAITFSLILLFVWQKRNGFVKGRHLLPVIWIAAVVTGPFAFDILQGTYTAAVPRYAIAALPAACLLLSAGMTGLRHLIRWAVLIMLLIGWAPSFRSVLNIKERSGFKIGQVVNLIGDQPTEEDVVIVHSIPSGIAGVARYYQGTAPIYPWVGQLGTRKVPESIESIVKGRQKIYFIQIHDVGEPAPELDWLREHTTLEFEEDWGAGAVYVFSP